MKSDILEELYKKYYNEAKLYMYSLTHDLMLSEDIVCDAFYKALTTLDNNIVNFKYWLLKVCKNAYIDYYRRNKKQTVIEDDYMDEENNPLDKIIKDDKYKSLYKAIDLLDSLSKEVLLLFYFQNLKISEIASVLNKTEDNIKVILYRSREKLKKILEVNE